MASSPHENMPTTRSYQQEMLDASLRQNVVIALDTGSGKTHIAILRIKIQCDRDTSKVSWFIAPTVSLCEQQRDVMGACLPVPIGLISGALQPDQWTDEILWRRTIATHRVVVSTPQVLLDALRHGYLNMGRDIGLLVFDEAHHASDSHPYNMIMREFYDSCEPRTASNSTANNTRPSVLGLTASPAFGGNIDKAFQKIEQNLDSVILAPRQNRDELAKHVHRPVFKKIIYQPLSYKSDWQRSANVLALSQIVTALDIQKDPTVNSLRHQLSSTTDPVKLKRIDQRLSQAIDKGDTFVHKGMHDFLRTAKELCIDIGPWAADWYVYSVVNKALKSDADAVHLLFAERHQNEKAYLIEVLKDITVANVSYDARALVRGCSPKANDFIAFLLHEKREWEVREEVFSGIVFITRRDGALALSELLSHHPCTSAFFSIGTLLGSSESNKRNAFLDITRILLAEKTADVLSGFRIGEKNLVISTAVAEEGIDIQACCSVFRWDLPQNMVSWAQSRGRARRKQSSFVLMFEDGSSHSVEVKRWEALESRMIQMYNEDRQRANARIHAEETKFDEEDDAERLEFMVPSTRAKVTSHSAISHVAHFCNTLRSLSRGDVQPVYDITPPDYPKGYHAVVENQLSREPLAKNPGPYGVTLTLPRLVPPSLRIHKTEEKFKSKRDAQRHVAFEAYVALYKAGLLNDNLLPLASSIAPLREEEVQTLLQRAEKREGLASVGKQIDPWTEMLLGKNENTKMEGWWLNELFVEGVGKFRMFTRREMPQLDLSRDILHDPETGPHAFSIRPVGPASLTVYEVTAAKHYTRIIFSVFFGGRLRWDDLGYTYLFLPMQDDVDVDDVWEERRAWAQLLRSERPYRNARERVTAQASRFCIRYNKASDVFMVANGHTFYRFKRWREEALSPEEEESIRKKFARYKDLEITYPLIEAQPFQSRIDFLVPTVKTKTPCSSVILLPQFTDVVLDNERNLMLGRFLPSILRAMFIKLITFHFQKSLTDETHTLRQIPSDLIQKALMAPAANAHCNYERLETLGDAVLKTITSLQLLAEHPTWPEGFLSKRKDSAVSNAHLASVAIGKRLYRWVIRRAFVGRKWTPDYSSPSEGGISSHVSDETVDAREDNEDITGTADDNEGFEGGESDGEENILKLSTKTLADVVESLIGTAFLTGGFDGSIDCVQAFPIEIGCDWKPISTRIDTILGSVAPLATSVAEFAHTEAILGYSFTKKMLLVEALMHASSQSDIQSVSYERMEFLGDALLDIIIVEALYRAEEEGKIFKPGEMHIRKAALVNIHFLGFICLRAQAVLDSSLPRWDSKLRKAVPATEKHMVRLANCLMHSSETILNEIRDAFAKYELGCVRIETELEHGKSFPWVALARLQTPKFLSDIVESTLAAVYLDSRGDMNAVKDVLERLGVLKVLRRLICEDIDLEHPVSRVSEWATKNQKMEGLDYKISQRYGTISCTLVVDGGEIKTVTERYNGKASEDYVRFRAAEESMPILLENFGKH